VGSQVPESFFVLRGVPLVESRGEGLVESGVEKFHALQDHLAVANLIADKVPGQPESLLVYVMRSIS
jgi:hypothetical protein